MAAAYPVPSVASAWPSLNRPALKKYGLSRPDLSAKCPKRSASRLRARSMKVSWYCCMPYDCLMRVISVNVCGIRSAAAKGLFRWLRRQDADFICLQETRSHEHQLAEHGVRLPGYHSFFCDAERKGYAGVALYTRHAPQRAVRGFGVPEFDREGRYLEAQFGELSVASLYLPSGSAGPERQASKFRFLDARPARRPLPPERRLEHCSPGHRSEELEVEPEELRFPARGARLDGSVVRAGRVRGRVPRSAPRAGSVHLVVEPRTGARQQRRLAHRLPGGERHTRRQGARRLHLQAAALLVSTAAPHGAP